MTGWRVCSIAGLVAGLAMPLPAAAGGPAVDWWIAAHAARLGGAESRTARLAVIGDLDGDRREDVAVLYTIDGANPGKRSLRYHLADGRLTRERAPKSGTARLRAP